MSLWTYRRRILILSVPIINFIFLVLFIFSPSSLPRIPKRFTTALSRSFGGSRSSTSVSHPLQDQEPTEHIRFWDRTSDGDGSKDDMPSNASAIGDFFSGNSLLEQRKLVEGVYLKPLPDHRITTYKPGNLYWGLQQYQHQQEELVVGSPPVGDVERNHPTTIATKETLDPSEKFITFLPHSGFHNQRSELENALLLARLLNRTLIMPKVYLGPPMPWLSWKLLHSRLLYQTKTGLEHCRALIDDQLSSTDDEEGEKGEDVPPVAENVSTVSIKPEKRVRQPLEPIQSAQPAQYDAQGYPESNTHRGSAIEERKPLENSSEEKIETIPAFANPPPAKLVTDHQALEQLEPTELIPSPSPDQIVLNEQYVDDLEENEQADLSPEEEDPQLDTKGEEEVDGEEEGEEEVMEPSWIEETEDDDSDRSIATGDMDGRIMGMDDSEEEDLSGEEAQPDVVEDWELVEDSEEGDIEGIDQTHVGIVDDKPWQNESIQDDDDVDDNDMDADDIVPTRRPDSFVVPQWRHHHHLRNRRQMRGRNLAQGSKEMDGASLPLYMPVDTKNPNAWQKRSLHKRSSVPEEIPLENSKVEQQLQQQQQQPQPQSLSYKPQMVPPPSPPPQTPPPPPQTPPPPPPPPPPLPVQQVRKHRKQMEHNLLPAECLQYESWSMTDWDFFFDMDPLRKYVRIVTREAMSMAYLESEFGIQMPKVEEEQAFNSTNSTANSLTDDKEISADDPEPVEEEDSGEKEPPPLLRTAGDVLFFDDSSLYDYMFTEDLGSLESAKVRSKYRQEFTIQWLTERPEKLIHLGSLFGTGRVSIDSLENKAWLMKIRDHLILKTRILQETSQRIVEKISGSNLVNGGSESSSASTSASANASGSTEKRATTHAGMVDAMDAGFIGVHIRMSDGHFSLSARNTIENIRQELMWQMGMSQDEDGQGSSQEGGVNDHAHLHDIDEHSQQQASLHHHHQGYPENSTGGSDTSNKIRRHLSLEQCRSRALHHREQLLQNIVPPRTSSMPTATAESSLPPPLSPPPPPSPLSPRRRSNGRYTPIYLATDARHPRSNPIFSKLFSTFDCVFVLDDFEEDLELLHEFRNPDDGVLLTKFLIPMVDAMVVAKAGAFFGTPASTFSNYIQRQLRPAYTGLYD
ncbi:hypothetical protein BG004_003203 [Podila humilis]|nr:hypothetical protein BG004_003203 [Podila humilis]